MADDIRRADDEAARRLMQAQERAAASNVGLPARLTPFVQDFVSSAASLGIKPDTVVKRLGLQRKAWLITLSFVRPDDLSEYPYRLQWPLLIWPNGKWHFYRYTGPVGTTWPNHYMHISEQALGEQTFPITDDQIRAVFVGALKSMRPRH